MGTNETEFLVDESGVKSSILELSHPELSGMEPQAEPDLLDQINEGNINTFAHHMVMSDSTLATKLLDELLYWRKQGQI